MNRTVVGRRKPTEIRRHLTEKERSRDKGAYNEVDFCWLPTDQAIKKSSDKDDYGGNV